MTGAVHAAEITQTRYIEFGTIPALNGTCSMDRQGTLSGICFGTGELARFRITGEPRQQVQVSVAQGRSTGTGVLFEPQITGSVTRLNKRGRANVLVMGRLTLNQPSVGQHDLSFVVNVFFE